MPRLFFTSTDFDTMLNGSTESTAMLAELTRDPDRNRQICSDIAGDDTNGIKLVLSDRKEHCQELANYSGKTPRHSGNGINR
jgi:hypothetical protein